MKSELEGKQRLQESVFNLNLWQDFNRFHNTDFDTVHRFSFQVFWESGVLY